MIQFHKDMTLGEFLSQECTQEEWDTLFDPPPLAPRQNFIGPRAYPPKWLRCTHCDEWVQICDKYRRATKATCQRCA